MSTSATPSNDCDGSMTRPPASRTGLVIRPPPAPAVSLPAPALRCFRQLRRSAREEIQDCHAHCHAVRHLIEDYAERSVGHVGVDFDAAIHRAGMKNENL